MAPLRSGPPPREPVGYDPRDVDEYERQQYMQGNGNSPPPGSQSPQPSAQSPGRNKAKWRMEDDTLASMLGEGAAPLPQPEPEPEPEPEPQLQETDDDGDSTISDEDAFLSAEEEEVL